VLKLQTLKSGVKQQLGLKVGAWMQLSLLYKSKFNKKDGKSNINLYGAKIT
jgi:hypothetical protein